MQENDMTTKLQKSGTPDKKIKLQLKKMFGFFFMRNYPKLNYYSEFIAVFYDFFFKDILDFWCYF